MIVGHGRIARLGLVLLVSAGLAVGQAPRMAAAQDAPTTYAGPPYSTESPDPPTRAEMQSKIWFSADAWWALLLEPTGRSARVFELMPDHSWRPTSAVVNPDQGDIGDALHDGDTVHVLTRGSDGSLYYVHLSFDAPTRDYRADPPVLVTTRSSAAPASIAKDTAGRLWVTYATETNVLVMSSGDGGRTWGRITVLANPGSGTTPEAAALVAYDDRVGVLWSDQKSGSFEFASRGAGDAPDIWSREQALTGPAGADNHISLVRVNGQPSDTLMAAVQTAPADPTKPSQAPLEVLVRTPDGRWSEVPVSTIADGLSNPVLQVDEATRTLHLFASMRGNIVEKRSSLDNIGFAAGPGDLFVLGPDGGLVDPTVTKDSIDSRSGLVVLASDVKSHTYRHAESPISPPAPVVDPADHTAPNPPSGLHGQALSSETVVLSWSAATDGDRWTPAGIGVPVRDYVLSRNGVEVATLTATSIQDHPPAGGDIPAGGSITYQVQAVDLSGNRSPPATIVVDLPTPGTRTTAVLIGIALLVLAALAGCYDLRRRRRAQAMTSSGRPDQTLPALSGVPERSSR